MNDRMYAFVSIDMMPLIGGVLAALCCGLLGNHLVLRKQSLMGDAISHAVLPGLVLAFLISDTRHPLTMFVGAAISAIVTVILIQIVRRLGRVEHGAAMGVIFSVLFALGVFLLEQGGARKVDLDASCVLYGQLENLFWFPPKQWDVFFSAATLHEIPRQIWTLFAMTIAVVVFMGAFYKELRISAFDPGISSSQGIHAGAMQFILMIFVAAAAVASFEAVGSILVIAMLICPASTARLMTDRMGSQILVSAIAAIVASTCGYAIATHLPESWVRGGSVNSAGMMAVMSGALLCVAIVASPTHGVIVKLVHRRKLQRRIMIEDLLAAMYRAFETGQTMIQRDQILAVIAHPGAISSALSQGLVEQRNDQLALTEDGLRRGASLIRKHRLWEGYLVERAGMQTDHVHDVAETLEHLDDPSPSDRDAPRGDPHGKPMPPAN